MAQTTLKTGKFFRAGTLDAVDADGRTVDLAFSSEMPVDRVFGDEILDHGPDSVRLDWFNGGTAPLLLDHDPTRVVGVVSNASIGSDRVGRAQVRFGQSDLAAEVLQDVADGVRANVSVGYRINRMVQERRDGRREVFRAVDWTPLEVSLVAIPADPAVGVGRETGEEFDTLVERSDMPETIETLAAEAPPAEATADAVRAAEPPPPVDTQKIARQARAEELARIQDITTLARKFGKPELGESAIREGVGVDAFRATLLENIIAAPEVNPTPLGMSPREIKRFSVVRALRALASPRDAKARADAAYEFEASQAAADVLGRTVQGVMIPPDVLNHGFAKRALSAGGTGTGAELVAEDLLADSFIDLLRNRTVLGQLGMSILSDLVGNVAIPRQTAGATAGWIDPEGAAAPEQTQGLDQVLMTPRTLGAFTDYTRQLLLQSSIDVEMFVRNDLTNAVALGIDLGGLYGTGAAGQPTGLVNQTGVTKTTFAGAVPTWEEIVDLETQVATGNADVGSLAYILEPTARGSFKTTTKDPGSGMFLWEPGDTVNGYPTGVTNQVTAGDLFFGNWAVMILALWGGLDLTVDPYSLSTSGTVRIVALQSVDVAVRTPESFAWGNDTP